MALTRRALVLAVGLAPLVQVAASLRGATSASATAAAPALRPPARGTSGRVCARCGAAGHSTLDGGCPVAAEQTAARQGAVRRALAGSPAVTLRPAVWSPDGGIASAVSMAGGLDVRPTGRAGA
jgi:hypothetical protein